MFKHKLIDFVIQFMEDIDKLLENYSPGRPENKPDVVKQLSEMKASREIEMQKMIQQQQSYNDMMNKISMINNPQAVQQKLVEQSMIIQQLVGENTKLKTQVEYLNEKIKQLIALQLEKNREEKSKETKEQKNTDTKDNEEKRIQLVNNDPTINIV